jgi:kynurenine formamidase
LKLIDLSHEIVPDMLQWPGDRQALKIHRHSEHGPDSHMSSSLEFGCHVGTHVDGALHFLAGQTALHQVALEAFSGRALVVDATAASRNENSPAVLPAELLAGIDLSALDFVLFHTGWDRHWGTDFYYRHWPSLSEELACLLAASELKGVGLDTPSLDLYDGSIAHDLCAAAGMINIENLTGLEPLTGEEVHFMALPLKLFETEASPVRAVAWRFDWV